MNNNIKRHLGNISRSVGHDVTTKYSYIINESDLINAWLKFHNDLGYPLMTDSKYHRTIIYNKQGLEQQIQKMITKVMEKNGQVLADIIANDINNKLDSLTQTANGRNRSSHLVATAMVKGLVNGFFKILDDITTPNDNYRR